MQAAKAYTLRRGTTEAKIKCLAFSGAGVGPQLLAAASSHGTVHIWNLETPGLSRRYGNLDFSFLLQRRT